jgi:ankyrin repeat protein
MTTIDQEKLNNDLIKYAKFGGLTQVKLLIEQGADIHANGDLPLKHSSCLGNFDIMKYLIENGADIKACDNAVLEKNASIGNLDMIEYLVDHGIDLIVKGDNILKCSAETGHLEVVKYLIIDCNMIVKEETLQWLQENGHLETINIINSRDFNYSLNNKLSYNKVNNNSKVKI